MVDIILCTEVQVGLSPQLGVGQDAALLAGLY